MTRKQKALKFMSDALMNHLASVEAQERYLDGTPKDNDEDIEQEVDEGFTINWITKVINDS